MTTYELMVNTNHRLMTGEVFTDAEKFDISGKFLSVAIIPQQIPQFGTEHFAKARRPLFFVPPHNDGKKLKTILGQIPKTHILNGNMYELEIIRLLCLFAPYNLDVCEMTAQTLNRLKATCFGYHGCSLGECFDSALVVLRFMTVAAPSEMDWMKKIIRVYNKHHAEKRRIKAVRDYYRLCISELPFEITDNEDI